MHKHHILIFAGGLALAALGGMSYLNTTAPGPVSAQAIGSGSPLAPIVTATAGGSIARGLPQFPYRSLTAHSEELVGRYAVDYAVAMHSAPGIRPAVRLSRHIRASELAALDL